MTYDELEVPILLPIWSQSMLVNKAYKTSTSVKFEIHQEERIVHTPGPRLNIKTVLSTYGDFHVKDKTAVRTSYL